MQLSLITPEILKPLVFNLDPLIHNILLCELAALQDWVEAGTNGLSICVKLSHGDFMPTSHWVLEQYTMVPFWLAIRMG